MKKTIFVLIVLINIISFNLFAQKTKDKTIKAPQKSSLTSYEKYIDDNNDAHLKEFMELLSIPSISSIPANKPDVDKAAAWIVNKLKAIGITTAQTIPTEGNAVVYGSWENAPGKPTVLIYAHYDVQTRKGIGMGHTSFYPGNKRRQNIWTWRK